MKALLKICGVLCFIWASLHVTLFMAPDYTKEIVKENLLEALPYLLAGLLCLWLTRLWPEKEKQSVLPNQKPVILLHSLRPSNPLLDHSVQNYFMDKIRKKFKS